MVSVELKKTLEITLKTDHKYYLCNFNCRLKRKTHKTILTESFKIMSHKGRTYSRSPPALLSTEVLQLGWMVIRIINE